MAAGGASSSLRCGGFSLQWLSWSQSTGSRRAGFRSRGAQACLLHGMWDLPGSGIEPTPLALTGVFLSTRPPGKLLPHPTESLLHNLIQSLKNQLTHSAFSEFCDHSGGWVCPRSADEKLKVTEVKMLSCAPLLRTFPPVISGWLWVTGNSAASPGTLAPSLRYTHTLPLKTRSDWRKLHKENSPQTQPRGSRCYRRYSCQLPWLLCHLNSAPRRHHIFT